MITDISSSYSEQLHIYGCIFAPEYSKQVVTRARTHIEPEIRQRWIPMETRWLIRFSEGRKIFFFTRFNTEEPLALYLSFWMRDVSGFLFLLNIVAEVFYSSLEIWHNLTLIRWWLLVSWAAIEYHQLVSFRSYKLVNE